ncbi:MAG: MarR family transcriptional regulator [Firmicutes bacterium]|nr:MarR family transcriptional regulator [Dethiobacter sp.]MBS3888108.1 MarR family transcriptional regulator [Bacillota bacterium]MBS4054552.1 MarR family transcriptional regulator [Thermaerobacter sp.]
MAEKTVLKHLVDLFMQIGARATMETLVSTEDMLTNSQLLALRYIWLHPDCPLSSLAEGLGISNPAATKVMDRLARKDLVLRKQGLDRRQIIAILTPKGRDVVENQLRLQMVAYAKLFDMMSETELASLQAGLEGMVDAAVRHWPDWQQLCLRCGTGCSRTDCPLFRYTGA